MSITVILCTFNRCQSLTLTLESIAASTVPGNIEWEVLVIDNNSSDGTRHTVEDFCRIHPGHFRYLFEPNSGKSYALNTGIRNAQGKILVFVDDDVTVEPSWLLKLANSLQDPNWAGVGGRTLLAEKFSPPRWMATDGPFSMAGILAAKFDLGDKPCELCPPHQPPYGANMAFRREMFEKYGMFRTDLGPSPDRTTPRPNEDTEFGRRLIAAGEHIRYEPSAIVYHPVTKKRINKQYFLTWWFDYGRAAIREVGRRPDINGIPRRYFTISKTAATLVGRALSWMTTWDSQARFFRKCRVWATAGQIVEVNRQWR